MFDIQALKRIDYRPVNLNELMATDDSPEKSREIGEYLDVSQEPDEDLAIANFMDYCLDQIFKKFIAKKGREHRTYDAEDAAKKTVLSLKGISSHPFKLVNASAPARGVVASGTRVSVPGLFSGTAHMMFKQFSYNGDAKYYGYGKMLTDNILTREGRTSLFEMAGRSERRFRAIIEKTALLQGHEEFVIEASLDAYHHLTEGAGEKSLNPYIKQIHFPVGSTEHHLLAIVNHGGLRKGMSDYLKHSEMQSAEGTGNSKTRNLWYPTSEISIGGRNPQNAGEATASLVGRIRLLSAEPPRYQAPREVPPRVLSAIEREGSPFVLIRKRRIHLDRKGDTFYRRLARTDATSNQRARAQTKAVFGSIVRDVMEPVNKFLQDVEQHEDALFNEMTPATRKWVDAQRFPGSISASEYRELATLCRKMIFKKVNFIKERKPYILSDGLIECLDDVIIDYLRNN